MVVAYSAFLNLAFKRMHYYTCFSRRPRTTKLTKLTYSSSCYLNPWSVFCRESNMLMFSFLFSSVQIPTFWTWKTEIPCTWAWNEWFLLFFFVICSSAWTSLCANKCTRKKWNAKQYIFIMQNETHYISMNLDSYQQIAEIMDFGYPQNLSPEILKLYITQEGVRSPFSSKVRCIFFSFCQHHIILC